MAIIYWHAVDTVYETENDIIIVPETYYETMMMIVFPSANGLQRNLIPESLKIELFEMYGEREEEEPYDISVPFITMTRSPLNSTLEHEESCRKKARDVARSLSQTKAEPKEVEDILLYEGPGERQSYNAMLANELKWAKQKRKDEWNNNKFK